MLNKSTNILLVSLYYETTLTYHDCLSLCLEGLFYPKDYSVVYVLSLMYCAQCDTRGHRCGVILPAHTVQFLLTSAATEQQQLQAAE